MNTILIIDTEGNEPREIGGILWNLITNNVQEFLSGQPHSKTKIDQLNELIHQCDAIVAHSAGHDKHVLSQVHEIHIDEKQWICTIRNFKWPSFSGSWKLKDICNSYNIPRIDAHSAIGDCRLLHQCLSQITNVREMLQTALNNAVDRKETRMQFNLFEDVEPLPFNGQCVIARFFLKNGSLRKCQYKSDNLSETIIKFPQTIEIFKQTSNINNAQEIQEYISDKNPIQASMTRFSHKSGTLFTIGAKNEEDALNSALISKEIKERKLFWLITTKKKFLLSRGNLHQCKPNICEEPIGPKIIFPMRIKINPTESNCKNVQILQKYIEDEYPVCASYRVKSYGKTGIIFTIGEKNTNSEFICESKIVIEPTPEHKSKIKNTFHIRNQTTYDDAIFMNYLDQNKDVVKVLQENQIRFAPIMLNRLYFILFWNAHTNTLEIVREMNPNIL